MRVAIIGGRRVAYEVGGDPSGQPTLIIHGAWGGPNSTLWNGPRLRWPDSDGLRLIYYDRRCAGLSGYDSGPFTLDDLAADAVELLDYLKIQRAAVVATSAGGPIGLRMALDFPQRVASLALVNTGAALMSLKPSGVDHTDPFVADRLATVAKRLAMLDLLESGGIDAVLAASEDEWRSPPEPLEPDESLTHYRDNRRAALRSQANPELARLASGALLNMQAQRDLDLLAEASLSMCPTLIVHGDADTTVPIAYGRALADAMSHATFVVLNGEGHGLITLPRAQRVLAEWLLGR